MKIKDLNKHLFDDDMHCIGFDMMVGDLRFHVIKETVSNDNRKIWRLKSYEDINIPTIAFSMPKEDCSLVLIAKTGFAVLDDYLEARLEMIEKVLQDIYEELKSN